MDGQFSLRPVREHSIPHATSRPWVRYLITVGITVALLVTTYAGALAMLQQSANLPPPPIVNEVCADEKLQWLRNNAPDLPSTLVVGSSVAFRNVDVGQLAVPAMTQPLNGGMCHLKLNQTAFVTGYLLRHFPSVRTVTVVVAPQDLDNCTKAPAQIFDPATADAYVFDHRWPYRIYFSQFDFVSLVRNAVLIRGMREARNPLDPLMITRYGDGPLDTNLSRGLTYGKFPGYDPACFTALHDLASAVVSGGRRFLMATSPLNPAWSARYDPSGQLHADMVAGIQSALHSTGSEFWDGGRLFAGAQSEFTDAIHIRWSAAQRYGAMLAAALNGSREQL